MIKEYKKYNITYNIIFICILIFLLCNYIIYFSPLNNYPSSDIISVLLFGALLDINIVVSKEFFRFFTYGFLHLDLLHLLFNLIALNTLSKIIQNAYGKYKMLIIILISIIGAGLMSFFIEKNSIIIGLSGGIYGLLGAYIVIIFDRGLYKIPVIKNNLITIIGLNIGLSLLPGISFFGHLGGFITGFLVSLTIKNKLLSLKPMQKNAKISLVILFVFMIFNLTIQINKDIDISVIEYYQYVVEDLGIDIYADKLKEDIIKYEKR